MLPVLEALIEGSSGDEKEAFVQELAAVKASIASVEPEAPKQETSSGREQ